MTAELIRRHYGASLRIARSILRNQPDSEDAVQTAYGRALQQLHTFREEARFRTWITSIVVNQSSLGPPWETACDTAQFGRTDE
jgi:RNA polymerase sigma-70 factor (ECF subfamily)